MIKPVNEITKLSNLDVIGLAIDKANAEGKRWLALYKTYGELKQFYAHIFSYNKSDIARLKELGYRVEVAHEHKIYDGYLWWKKHLFTITYHIIYW